MGVNPVEVRVLSPALKRNRVERPGSFFFCPVGGALNHRRFPMRVGNRIGRFSGMETERKGRHDGIDARVGFNVVRALGGSRGSGEKSWSQRLSRVIGLDDGTRIGRRFAMFHGKH